MSSLTTSSIGEQPLNDLVTILNSFKSETITFQWDETRLWVTDWVISPETKNASSAFVWQLPKSNFAFFETSEKSHGQCSLYMSRLPIQQLFSAQRITFSKTGLTIEYQKDGLTKFNIVMACLLQPDVLVLAPDNAFIFPCSPDWKSLNPFEFKIVDQKYMITPNVFIHPCNEQHMNNKNKQYWFKDEQTPFAIVISPYLVIWLELCNTNT